MDLIELLSLMAGSMTTGAPITQAFKTWRSRDYAGLSIESYLLLLCLGTLTVLIGLQYRIVSMTVLNALGLSANLVVMFMISRRTLAGYIATLCGLALVSSLVAPWFIPTLLTARWAEQVAFVYGLIAAGTFLPQLLLTRRTRVVSALSIFNLVLFAGGVTIWIGVAIMLGNYSLTGWNIILLFMVLELLRLKVIYGRRKTEAQGDPATAITPPSAAQDISS